jgi:hypothetical protein
MFGLLFIVSLTVHSTDMGIFAEFFCKFPTSYLYFSKDFYFLPFTGTGMFLTVYKPVRLLFTGTLFFKFLTRFHR